MVSDAMLCPVYLSTWFSVEWIQYMLFCTYREERCRKRVCALKRELQNVKKSKEKELSVRPPQVTESVTAFLRCVL